MDERQRRDGTAAQWSSAQVDSAIEGLRVQHLSGVCNALVSGLTFILVRILLCNSGHCVDQDGLNLTERFSCPCLPSAPLQLESPSFNPQ